MRHRLTKISSDILAVARSKDPFATSKSAIVAILGIWLTVVIFTASRHEFWRDEVRALSFARAAVSPLDLFGLTRYEGHPVLWYFLLYIGKSIADTPLVLPVISITIGFAAVAIFMFSAPFALWFRCLFIFSALPFYEYSVMARNYGISMLLLFVGAILYRKRAKYSLWLAFVLALLANANVHSAILAGLIAALWVWDTVVEQRTAPVRKRGLSLYLPFVIVFAGVLLCAASTVPREDTIQTSIRRSFSMRNVAYSSVEAVLEPERTFAKIVPAPLPSLVVAALLYLAAFGLLHKPNLFLAGLSGQVSFGVLFRMVYSGGYRHQGLFLVFLLFLYWIFIDSLNNEAMTRTKHLLFHIGLYVAMLTLISLNVVKGQKAVWTDIRLEMSSSKAFGEFLNNSATYRDAVIVPEPDVLLESLPYYAKNRIYFPREQRFGTTVSWATEGNARLSLGELLSTARDIKIRYGKPVLIVLGHPDVGKYKSGERKASYHKLFSWNSTESADFNESTILVREFNSAVGDENYRVYTVR